MKEVFASSTMKRLLYLKNYCEKTSLFQYRKYISLGHRNVQSLQEDTSKHYDGGLPTEPALRFIMQDINLIFQQDHLKRFTVAQNCQITLDLKFGS